MEFLHSHEGIKRYLWHWVGVGIGFEVGEWVVCVVAQQPVHGCLSLPTAAGVIYINKAASKLFSLGTC